MCKWRSKTHFFLNLSCKFPADVRVRTSKYPYMDMCADKGEGGGDLDRNFFG